MECGGIFEILSSKYLHLKCKREGWILNSQGKTRCYLHLFRPLEIRSSEYICFYLPYSLPIPSLAFIDLVLTMELIQFKEEILQRSWLWLDLAISSLICPSLLSSFPGRRWRWRWGGGRVCSQVCNRSDQAGINYRSPHYMGGSEVRKFQFNTLQILKWHFTNVRTLSTILLCIVSKASLEVKFISHYYSLTFDI